MGILTWENWCEVFDDYSFFQSLIHEIFLSHELGEIEFHENLTPGTNAVFRVNDYVVKIYVPEETAIWCKDEYVSEIKYIEQAIRNGIKTPNMICTGTLQKEQAWRYVVFEYVEADDIGNVLSSLSKAELIEVTGSIKQFIEVFHIPGVINDDIKYKGIEKDFWKPFSIRFMQNVRSYIGLREFEGVHTHGDLTGDNILYNGEVYYIDFADASVTPKAYEYPPIVFDLLKYDLEMAMLLVDNDFDLLIDYLTDGIILHEYGGDMLKDILKRLHIEPIELIDVEDIKNAIIDILK